MLENIRISFQGIFSHKIRSFLTMLGIIIGIAAIIAIVSTIKGTNEQIKSNLIGSDNNTVNVRLKQAGSIMDFEYGAIPDGIPEISQPIKDELEAVPEIVNSSAYRHHEYIQSFFYGKTQIESGSIYGIDSDYFSVKQYQIVKGKGFSPRDYKGFSKVCVIDDTICSSVFGSADPIGQILDIEGEPFTIIGTAVKVSTFEPVINTIDDYWTYNEQQSGIVFIPSKAWPILYRYDEPESVIVQAKDTDSMTTAGKEAADILNSYLNVGESDNITYVGEDLLDQAKEMQELSSSTNTMLVWIASISLLVGGIGVMNIMLVSVTERTREIGLKKALGARKTRILLQFLTEASVLTSIGGVIGVLAGIGLAQVISRIAEVPVAISTPAIIVSVAFSMVVGIVFGLIPSIKAARLDPIDALRYE